MYGAQYKEPTPFIGCFKCIVDPFPWVLCSQESRDTLLPHAEILPASRMTECLINELKTWPKEENQYTWVHILMYFAYTESSEFIGMRNIAEECYIKDCEKMLSQEDFQDSIENALTY